MKNIEIKISKYTTYQYSKSMSGGIISDNRINLGHFIPPAV